MFIVEADFIGLYELQFAEYNDNVLNQIEDIEGDFMRRFLGNTEWVDLKNNPTSAKWTDFVNGATFDYSGHTYVYDGIKSVLIPLVWQKYVQLNSTQLVENKESTVEYSYSTKTNNKYKYLSAYETGRKCSFIMKMYLMANQANYENLVWNDLLPTDMF